MTKIEKPPRYPGQFSVFMDTREYANLQIKSGQAKLEKAFDLVFKTAIVFCGNLVECSDYELAFCAGHGR